MSKDGHSSRHPLKSLGRNCLISTCRVERHLFARSLAPLICQFCTSCFFRALALDLNNQLAIRTNCCTFIKSAYIKKLLYEMRRYQTVSSQSAADMFVPKCMAPFNAALHELACRFHTVISDEASTAEFERFLSNEDHFAALFHRSASFVQGGVMLSFRFQGRVFFYLPNHSRRQRAKIASILHWHAREKKLFVFMKEVILPFLKKEFSWRPSTNNGSEKLPGSDVFKHLNSGMLALRSERKERVDLRRE